MNVLLTFKGNRMLKILPQQFYQNPSVNKILVDGLSCIIHKTSAEVVLHKEGYVSAHAITLVLKGKLRVEKDNGIPIHVHENQMIFLPRGIYMISDFIPDSDVFEAVVFFFDEELLSSFVTANQIHPIKEKQLDYKILAYTDSVRYYTESLLKLYQDKALATRGVTRLKLTELLHLLSSSGSGSCFVEALATLHNKQRRSIKEFMTLNFSKPLSIEDYAYLTGRSLSTFRRDFLEHFGVSPKQWLIDMRLEKARQLFERNNTNVAQVAMEVGYENMSHFIKAFHKKYGRPPKQFVIQKRQEVLV
jgi:AraC family transcriptional regulator, exoenzyme S synthesis regulatory protein ExsA